jgi:hypothetical protein
LSLAFNPATGIPAISYVSFVRGDRGFVAHLKYAEKTGGGWTKAVVDSGSKDLGYVGFHSSLAFDRSGKAAIAYFDELANSLKLAYFNGASWGITTIDPEVDYDHTVFMDISLAFNPRTDQPHIGYSSRGIIKYAEMIAGRWFLSALDSAPSTNVSLRFNPRSGDQTLLYYDEDGLVLNEFIPAGAPFSGIWLKSSFLPFRVAGCPLAFDASSNPATAFFDEDGALNFARYNTSRTSAEVSIVDAMPYQQRYGWSSISMAYNPLTGTPGISYYDSINGDLKFAQFIPPRLPSRLWGFLFSRSASGQIEPIDGVKLVLKRTLQKGDAVKESTFTNENGYYEFSNLPSGSYQLEAKHCKGNKSKEVGLQEGQDLGNLNFKCE